MKLPLLIAITDTEALPDALLLARWERVAAAARAGSAAVQLRARGRSARELLELGRALRSSSRQFGQWLIVNDRIDVALILEADGLHLGEASVEVRDARRLSGERAIFRACHAPEAAAETHADAVLLSPVLESRKGSPALGLEALTQARRGIEQAGRRTALYALGGVDAAQAAACLQAGADGVAVMAAVFGTDEPSSLVRALGIER